MIGGDLKLKDILLFSEVLLLPGAVETSCSDTLMEIPWSPGPYNRLCSYLNLAAEI